MQIEKTLNPTSEDIDFLTEKLSSASTDFGKLLPFAFFVRDDAGNIIAGCNGSIIFSSIYTDQLWVAPEYRKQGLASELMRQVHDLGRENGCTMATLFTMSFQGARIFYEKLGYRLEYERKGYARGASSLFLKRQIAVEIAEYDKNWPAMYEAEAKRIHLALGENCTQIHHVGSTSVPGLSAKPKIDIIAVVKDFTPIINKLKDIGYEYRGGFNLPFRKSFNLKVPLNVNLHVFEEGDAEIELNLLFRDYLRSSGCARMQYQQLKYELAAQNDINKKDDNIYTRYTLGKHDFISSILQKAGFARLRLVFATHKREWEAYRRIRGEECNYLQDETNYHFVLYNGVEVVAIAHVEFSLQSDAVLKFIASDGAHQWQGFEENLVELLKKWAVLQGRKLIKNC